MTDAYKDLHAAWFADKAAELVSGDRQAQHGDKSINFKNIATLWNGWMYARGYVGVELTAHDVGVMMAMTKAARTLTGKTNPDDYVDACGYFACAGEIACST